MNQNDLRNRLLIEHEAVTRDALTVAYGLTDEQLAWSRPDSWSIGQLFEHLVITSDSYCSKMRGRVFDAHAPHAMVETEVEWEPSLMGWMMVKRLRSPRPMPAPRIFAPDTKGRVEVVNAFIQRQANLTYLLRASAALHWNRVRVTSPVNALIRLNLGDAFQILIVHAQRHIGQMAQLREMDLFPSEHQASA
ncbi:MAG: DinB family protein [Gemmatimonadales bacterium]